MRKMANYLKTILGDLLCKEYMDGDGPTTLPNVLPSPDKLRKKVLAKNKKLAAKDLAAVAVVISMHTLVPMCAL